MQNAPQSLRSVVNQLVLALDLGRADFLAKSGIAEAHIHAVLTGAEPPSKALLDALLLEDIGHGRYVVKKL